MKYLLAILLAAGSANTVVSQINFNALIESLSTSFALLIEHGLSGYNSYLTSEQVLNFACAKPSDKIFNSVYFNDPHMSTKLDLSKPIGILTHGWIQNGYTDWMIEVSEAWVANHDTNVCRMDWSIYSMVEYVVAARRNVNLVSKHLAKFLKSLHAGYGVEYSDVTIMGHSMGGQICGVTGYILGGQIGRIIAKDPAGTLFTHPWAIASKDRLDKSDALFVTVVHSNNYKLGVGYSIGHADYYVNGKGSIQPGCVFPLLYGNYAYDINPVTCSHFRAIKYVQLTMAKDPLCRAIKCDTNRDYLTQQCTNTTDTWGINSDLIEGDFYFWSGLDPKCMNTYWPTGY